MPWSDLHPVKAVIVEIVSLHRAALARLPLGRQPALDATALRIGLSLAAGPLDDLLLLVDADDHVPDDLVHDPQPAVNFFHQLARPVDDVEDVDALLVV